MIWLDTITIYIKRPKQETCSFKNHNKVVKTEMLILYKFCSGWWLYNGDSSHLHSLKVGYSHTWLKSKNLRRYFKCGGSILMNLCYIKSISRQERFCLTKCLDNAISFSYLKTKSSILTWKYISNPSVKSLTK